MRLKVQYWFLIKYKMPQNQKAPEAIFFASYLLKLLLMWIREHQTNNYSIPLNIRLFFSFYDKCCFWYFRSRALLGLDRPCFWEPTYFLWIIFREKSLRKDNAYIEILLKHYFSFQWDDWVIAWSHNDFVGFDVSAKPRGLLSFESIKFLIN